MSTKTQTQKSQTETKRDVEAWTMSAAEREALIERVREAKRSGGQARYLAAQATHLAVVSGAIGTDRVWATQNDYALALGVDKSTVTGLKYLGAVVEATGITPDHEAWGILSARASSLGTYVKAQQKSGKPISLTGAKRAVGAAVKAADEKRKAVAEKRAGASAGGKGDTSAPLTREATTDDALALIRRTIPTMSKSEARVLAASLSTLLSEAQAQVKAAPVESDDEPATGTDG